MNPYYPHLFQPMTVKKTRFKNRIFSAPNFIPWVTSDNRPDDNFIRYYEAKAKGGAAEVTVPGGALDIDVNGGFGASWLRISDHMMPRMVELTRAIKQHGAVASFELGHCGLYVPGYDGGGPIGPSEVTRWDGVQVREMTVEQMNTYADSFARSAVLLKKAGFDMVMIHGGHGWIFAQFLAPEFNKRTDEYGGTLENRARFPIMVIDRIREAVGGDFLIEYRLSGDEMCPEGHTLQDAVGFSKLIQDKVDLIHVSAARDSTDEGSVITHPTIYRENGCNVYLAEAIRKEVRIPVVAIGAVNTPELAEEVLAAGKADFIAMARALIADPEFVNKSRTGRRDEIIPCIRCLDCLTGEHERDAFSCSVNPVTGHECRFDYLPKKAQEPLRVAVVGGGPGGMKAAITAAERGHRVTLLEKSGSLGGILRFTDYDELKVDLHRLKDYLVGRTEKLDIDVRLNTEATPELLAGLRPDAVIVATGSVPAAPPIPGLREHAVHVLEAYGPGAPALGERVVILGGGLAGCETAVDLARRGHRVSVVEMRGDLAPDANWMQREGMKVPIAERHIGVYVDTTCLEVRAGGVKVRLPDGGEGFLEADSVIYALGMKANAAPVDALWDSALTVVPVGDCVSPRQATQAIHEAYYAALDLG